MGGKKGGSGGSSFNSEKNSAPNINIVEMKNNVDKLLEKMEGLSESLDQFKEDASTESNRVDKLVEDENTGLSNLVEDITTDIRKELQAVRTTANNVETLLHTLARGLMDVGNIIVKAPGYVATTVVNAPITTNLEAELKEDKEILRKATKEIVDAYTKLIDRLDTAHNNSIVILTLLFALSFFFYSHSLPAGTRMKPVEFSGRVSIVILSAAVCMCYLWLQYQKICNIGLQLRALNGRFQDYTNVFTSLSESKEERAEKQPNTQGNQVELPVTAAAQLVGKYKHLEKRKLISAFEAETFRKQPIEMMPSTSKLYLWFIGLLFIGSAILMIAGAVNEFKNGSP
ncbi:hypothetical protein C5167_028440 [Papaver somniferum]|uniref:uncharacterized protein LOC113343303 n=1 Tax=Papaver somniferum TaxID=3469 RepID=UPI000E6FF267|nr:uncharacterized protein LOC113343303 [Papaver somniferum]RZC93082.1 hypothetical protein C5167_028440 [Papaver somniferum]